METVVSFCGGAGGIQLDRRDHLDSIRCLDYTRSSTAPPIKFISLMLPGFLSHRNETHQTPNSRCLVPYGHACSIIKAILHRIPTYSLTQFHSLSSVLPNLLSLLQTCLLSSKGGLLFSKHFLIHLNKSIKKKVICDFRQILSLYRRLNLFIYTS